MTATYDCNYSNFLESIAIQEKTLKIWETLERKLN